ncbi:hypothetical protein L1887_44452 [Cichorium endivia]|nr:hypothetical protein L1887_44452 [Cichorium endivia]
MRARSFNLHLTVPLVTSQSSLRTNARRPATPPVRHNSRSFAGHSSPPPPVGDSASSSVHFPSNTKRTHWSSSQIHFYNPHTLGN